ncbi:cobalamin biosynthesis protein CbiX [Halomonas sp. KAO]|uniref:sirohydrochlorin chelatase n=1 Tax=unclassified Halomonas TaxID=2609666 RepID=UPI00189DFAC6|nr:MULTISPECIES: CbiX/SirB N-terminal domain-containing protein [unclassified Halomonas]MBF7054957.1 cobalamin biosynthesis protein CbiX [Halomonas sp. KAO]MDT0501455.1 CbiX/SirB N-terminal domain-containing protein [Halomonas sp. PAR7]MDT0512871.1 CbiX/SirB N-terminal domain-containing protein [Halomonas sp. LES1]MDT0591304.1 CbiX/SirB N-terminal domain-containing protein [Halomonas sp. PAR8]
MQRILLVDNGSLRPQAVLNLRRLASALAAATGEPVEAASLLHSHKVPAEQLEGEPAATLGPLAERLAAEGVTELVIVPFFFGPSQALTRYLPERLAQVQERYPNLGIKVTAPLVDTLSGLDLRLARLLADNVREVMARRTMSESQPPKVVLVDHGSPMPEVTAVRNYVAGQLGVLLADEADCVTYASMERRDGDAYRFNEPLLADLLAAKALAGSEVILAMLFLSPGRHAGEGGDIAEICDQAMAASPGLRVATTRLVGEHAGILEILASRVAQGLSGDGLLVELPAMGKATRSR